MSHHCKGKRCTLTFSFASSGSKWPRTASRTSQSSEIIMLDSSRRFSTSFGSFSQRAYGALLLVLGVIAI
ncbi:MAG TPA: hypothetical protein VFA40_18475, partial [Terriglobales bacterium]|nr:hypothetical protein [Terriglobales bacterium]